MQPIGTPGLLLVKNFAFEAPGLDTGAPTDFTTDLGVYQDGKLLARKVIRVNDPLDGRWLHVPPERVRAGAGPRDPIHDRRLGAVVRAGPAHRCRGWPALRRAADPGPAIRPRAPAQPDQCRRRDADRPAVRGQRHEPGRDAAHRRGLPGRSRARRDGADGGPRPERPAARLQRLHAADRQARPGSADHLGRLRRAAGGPRDHVLPAAAPRLGALPAATAASTSSVAPIGRSTSIGSSAGSSTRSWRRAGEPPSGEPPGRAPLPQPGAG